MSKKFEELVLLQFNNLHQQLTSFQNQVQDQFSDVRKDIRRLDERVDNLDKKVDTLNTKIDDVRIELKNDISDWSRAYNLHDRKIFQNEGELRMVKAYIGMVDDSMLSPVLRDKGKG